MNNIIVITAISAWMISQLSKVAFGYFKHGAGDLKRAPWRIIWASGMPSSHSSLTISVLTIIGLKYGLNNELFGLSFVIAGITIYDRSRMFKIFSTFQKKFPALQKKVEDDPEIKELVGHSISEIIVGCIIGFFTGVLVYAL